MSYRNKSRGGPFSAPTGRRDSRGMFGRRSGRGGGGGSEQGGYSGRNGGGYGRGAPTVANTPKQLPTQLPIMIKHDVSDEERGKKRKAVDTGGLEDQRPATQRKAVASTSTATADFREELNKAEHSNHEFQGRIRQLKDTRLELETQLREEKAANKRDQALLTQRIRELEYNDRLNRQETHTLSLQLSREVEER